MTAASPARAAPERGKAGCRGALAPAAGAPGAAQAPGGRGRIPPMRYVTDIHALNLTCSLGTTGDWHASSLQWDHPRMLESEDSPWGDWGIEAPSAATLPGHPGEAYNVANHVRALADMVAQGRFIPAQGMSQEFLDGDEYDEELFEHILMLKGSPRWDDIDRFMRKEYRLKWAKRAACEEGASHGRP